MIYQVTKLDKQELPSLQTEATPKRVTGFQQKTSFFMDVETSRQNEFADSAELVTKQIGELKQGGTKHFYSFGNFNMMRLIFFLLKQTGPASIIMSSYSISQNTITGIVHRKEDGLIRDIRFIIDNRVKSISPKPFELLKNSFDYRCTSIHAKVACVWNETWHLTVISSQNATDNPKTERGIIFTDQEIFDFDFQNLTRIYDNGTT